MPRRAGQRPSLRARALLALLAAVIVAAWSGGAVRAADNTLSATLAPSEVALTPGESARVTLVISAGSTFTDPVVNVHPRPSATSVSVSPSKASTHVLPSGSAALEFTVKRTAEGSGQNVPVTFVIASQSKPPHVTTAMLDVKAVPSAALVDAKIESNVTTVDQNRPGQAALVITNPRENPLHVGALDVSAPDNVDVTLACPSGKLKTDAGTTGTLTDCRLDVAPRSQTVLHIDLAPTNAVVPGPRSLLVKVNGSGPSGASQSVVTTLAFTVDVFAESDILKSIGVPVFLLLPGVIIVLTAWFLIRWASPWRKTASTAKIDSIGSVVSAATFTAVLSLAVSLGVAKAYPWFTSTFSPGYERDYVKAYGFQDFYYVIGYSFVIAVIVWACAWLLYGVTPLARMLFVPTVGDEPATLLRKIGLRGFFGGKALFPRVTIANTPALDLGGRPAGRAIVAPLINVWIATDDEKLQKSIDADGTNDRAFKLWRTVSRAERNHTATLRYAPTDIPRPDEVERSQVTPTGSLMPIARWTSAQQ